MILFHNAAWIFLLLLIVFGLFPVNRPDIKNNISLWKWICLLSFIILHSAFFQFWEYGHYYEADGGLLFKDLPTYKIGFSQVVTDWERGNWNTWRETGFSFLAYCFAKVGFSFNNFLLFLSLFFFFSVHRFYQTFLKSNAWIAWLFILGVGFYFGVTNNIIRNGVAIACILQTMVFFKREQNYRAILVFGLASVFHNSTFLSLGLFLIAWNVSFPRKQYLFWFITVSFLVYLGSKYVPSFFGASEYSQSYFSEETAKGINFKILGILTLGIWLSKFSQMEDVFIRFLLLNTAFWLGIAENISDAYRFAYVAMFFAAIPFVEGLYACFPKSNSHSRTEEHSVQSFKV